MAKKIAQVGTYIVQPGDTLSTISKRLTGNANNYLKIASDNNISNPDMIYSGQELKIPIKYDKPLKFKEIPTKNELRIIDNYSKNYDYIVENDKIYYSRKGNDHWVDISDNEVARKNLYNFLGNNYNFRGYKDDESKIKTQLDKGTFNYQHYRDSVNNTINNFNKFVDRNLKELHNESSYNFKPLIANDIIDISKLNDENNKVSNDQKDTNKNLLSLIGNAFGIENLNGQLIKNGIRRKLNLLFNNDKEVHLNIPQELDSEYAIRPGIQVSDTLTLPSELVGRYFLSEYIPSNAYTYSARNRGDYKPRHNTEGAPITLLNPLLPYNSKTVNPNSTYVGYDSNGNLKVGQGKDFSEGDTMSRTFRNHVIKLETDSDGNVVGRKINKNRTFYYPNVTYYDDDGNIKTDSNVNTRSVLNVIFKNPNKYGSAQGGRVIIQTGDEIAIVSGSINTINKKFEEMKKRNGVNSGYFYTLDNGTFATGLRTKSKEFTSRHLQLYDQMNSGGGNFMYITGTPKDKFQSDTLFSPNIRTVNSESYKKGHSLENELKGVVLHHTAFTGNLGDKNTNVTGHFMNPKTEASAHVVIGENGERRIFANEKDVTFHAGKSAWFDEGKVRDNVNDYMLGVEFQGNTVNKPLTQAQIDSFIEYIKPIVQKYNIPLEKIITHQNVRDAYNDYVKKIKDKERKVDITQDQYKRIIDELLKKVYYKKSFGGKHKFKYGGLMKNKSIKLKGGTAIPLDSKNKLFYLSGAKHEQGGIDITPELEAEGGEVVKLNPKSIKVVTAQKIMGGKSPAELVVDASSTGKSEKVFNKVFNYQEDFKDRHNLNDDGTKKAKLGIIEKIKNSNVGKQILDHLKFETFFNNEDYDPNIISINDRVIEGEYDLYPMSKYSRYNKNNFYKKNDEIVYDSNWDSKSDYMQYKGYEPLNYDELIKMLPKRDYIGGSKRDVGIKVINKVPGLKDEILRLSEVYGISPNVFTQRLVNEGWVQDQAKLYNMSSVKNQKNYRWDRMNDFVDGFNTLGLDTFGDHHKEGHLNLRRDIEYDDYFTTNEDNTGRIYNSAKFDNMYDALEAKAAMIEYLTKLGKEKGHTDSDLDAWVNAAYNMGEYHEDLNNMDYVRRKYNVKPFYRYGGEMKNKKKANLGIFQSRPYGIFDKPLVDVNIEYDLPKIPNIEPFERNITNTPLGISKNNTLLSQIAKENIAKVQNPNTSLAIPSITIGTTTQKNKMLNVADYINIGTNTLGTLLNFGHALGNAKIPALIHSDPIPYTASKLNTKVNINAAKSNIRRTTDEIIDSINKNTADSSVARNAIRNAKLRERDALIDLYVNKENKENELINRDILNQQSARFKTIADVNTTIRENEKNKYLAELQTQENVNNAISSLTQNLAGITTNIADTLEQRNQFNKNLKVLGLTYPDLDVNRLNEVIYGDNTKSTKTKLSKEEKRTQKERERILYNARKNKIKMIRQGLIKPEDI